MHNACISLLKKQKSLQHAKTTIYEAIPKWKVQTTNERKFFATPKIHAIVYCVRLCSSFSAAGTN